MRGKAAHYTGGSIECRITPAYAGKSHLPSIVNKVFKGSPPPMRGKEYQSSFVARRLRITPAYAGKRIKILCHFKPSQDHPRLCGEKQKRFIQRTAKLGSPPPMRGKGVRRGKWQNAYRITPAYAGKSSELKKRNKKCRDHPRLCGEKRNLELISWSIVGSPPPMRGKVATGKWIGV